MQNNAPQKPSKENIRYLILLCVNTILFFCLYRILLYYAEMTEETFWSFVVMVSYLVLLLGFVLAYLIYNRFLYRKGLKREDLCEEWTEEEKIAFLEDGERRLKKSKWMITVIFPLIFTFFIDTLDLFILDPFFGS